jgi:3-(3-hydroxy-phenyl)propionate hydroxylase
VNSPAVLVAGAGPVGLTLALGLARQDIAVTVLEAGSDLSTESRASTFHPPTLEILDGLGLADELIGIGVRADTFQYRDRSGGLIAEFPMHVLSADTRFPFRIQCEQSKLTRLLLTELGRYPHADVQFGSSATSVDEVEDAPRVHVERAGQPSVSIRADIVVGADGASSAVRRSLGLEFSGKTYEDRYVVFSTTADFAGLLPGIANVNYIADPDEWLVLLRTPEHWRALFPVRDATASAAQASSEAAAQQRLQGLVRTSAPYPIAHSALYTVHQRVADRFYRGRVVLAGDAAHINNPVGGFGMNSGIHDAYMLSRLLPAVLEGHPAGDILARYNAVRRQVATESIAVQSDDNWRLLREPSSKRRARDQQRLRATAADPHSCRNYLRRASMLDPNPLALTTAALT